MESVPDGRIQQRRGYRRDRKCRNRRPRDDEGEVQNQSFSLRDLEPLSWLKRSDRALLHHFVKEASRVVISSRHGQRLFCDAIVPLALQSPSLLYATLAYSAAHQQSLRAAPISSIPDTTISRYVCSSLSAVQTELLHPSSCSKASLLAASLMLCLVSVASGEIHRRSWRVHAEGAKVLLASIRHSQPTSSSSDLEAVVRFLSRWYLSIESLTALTSSGLVTGQCVVQDTALGTITEPEQSALDVCDDHFGYPTKLALLFREIGASAWERRRQLKLANPQLGQSDFDLDAESLHSSLDQIATDILNPADGLMFYPGVREELSEADVRDFTACTEAYIYMARILIERRVKGTPSNSEAVQAPVRAIISAIQTITPAYGPSPAVAIGPPLFTAGCEALTQSDRQALRDTFRQFCSESKAPNMERTVDILEDLWRSDSGEPDWLEYQESRDWDFLPY